MTVKKTYMGIITIPYKCAFPCGTTIPLGPCHCKFLITFLKLWEKGNSLYKPFCALFMHLNDVIGWAIF